MTGRRYAECRLCWPAQCWVPHSPLCWVLLYKMSLRSVLFCSMLRRHKDENTSFLTNEVIGACLLCICGYFYIYISVVIFIFIYLWLFHVCAKQTGLNRSDPLLSRTNDDISGARFHQMEPIYLTTNLAPPRFVYLTFEQLAILSTCHFVSTIVQLDIWATQHFVNKSFC